MRAFFILFVLVPFFGWSQLIDPFSDGDLSNNPSWTGETNLFKVNTSFQLQLNQLNPRTDLADTAYLSAPIGLNDSLEWNFSIRMPFSPSDNNNARVYLLADQSNLEGELNAYFLQFGEAGSSDAVQLFKQTGTQTQSICRGTEGKIAVSFDGNIRVLHTKEGLWTIYTDWTKSGIFTEECSGQDLATISNPSFGFFCKFTSSNATKFYFDNVSVNHIYKDIEGPILEQTDLLNETQLRLKFNEELEITSAQNIQNYTILESNTKPQTAVLNPSIPSEVLLSFANEFPANQTLNLQIDHIKDLSDNILITTNAEFIFSRAFYSDVVFNEILADPSPVVGLPEIEFIEVYNRASYPVDLSNWKLRIGDSDKVIPNYILQPDEYLILCASTQVEAFANYGSVLGLSSFSLLNSGQYLALINNYNEIIDDVNYLDDWYGSSTKINGGWSLEKIQPNNICLIEENWGPSINNNGGTPGNQNSIYSSTIILPEITSAILKNDSVISLAFNQKMNPSTLAMDLSYNVNNSIGNPSNVTVSADNQHCELNFDSKFLLGIQYTLQVRSAIENCVGEPLSGTVSFSFELPKKADFGDVLIHEIMADPSPVQGLPDAEYIELYNQTDYPISLEGWKLKIGGTTHLFAPLLMAAKSYILIAQADDAAQLASFGQVVILPISLSNGGAQIALQNEKQQIIHYIEYTDNWYKEDYKQEGGWSLEMISTNYFCEQADNWAASQAVKGGSPGEANSLSNLNPSFASPKLSSLEILNTTSLRLQFSKSMDSLALKNVLNYNIDQTIGNPTELFVSAPSYRDVTLNFAKAFDQNTIYELQLENSLVDCSGSGLSNPIKAFAIPQEPEAGDVIINEVLFNSWLDDGEFVELYNKSDKVIDTRQLLFSKLSFNVLDTTYSSVQLSLGQLFPGEYLVITKNGTSLEEEYVVPNPDRVYVNADFPLLTNSEGDLLLSKTNQRSFVIDAFHYNENMHHPLLTSVRGVSLERLSPSEASNDPNNWQSAASNVNYGTPTYQNSQFQAQTNSEDQFQISPEVFSPDLDGKDDVLQINYRFAQDGYTLNVKIYNASGQQIRYLVKNEWMGTEGQLFWDGTMDSGEKATMGIYILYFEYFDLDGKVESLKKTCVLGGML